MMQPELLFQKAVSSGAEAPAPAINEVSGNELSLFNSSFKIKFVDILDQSDSAPNFPLSSFNLQKCWPSALTTTMPRVDVTEEANSDK